MGDYRRASETIITRRTDGVTPSGSESMALPDLAFALAERGVLAEACGQAPYRRMNETDPQKQNPAFSLRDQNPSAGCVKSIWMAVPLPGSDSAEMVWPSFVSTRLLKYSPMPLAFRSLRPFSPV